MALRAWFAAAAAAACVGVVLILATGPGVRKGPGGPSSDAAGASIPADGGGGEEAAAPPGAPPGAAASKRTGRWIPEGATAAEILAILDGASGDPGLRVVAFAALGELGDRSLLDELLRRYRAEKDRRVKYAALEALARIGGPEVNALLMHVVAAPDEEERDMDLRELAADSLAALGTVEAHGFLQEFLRGGPAAGEDPEEEMRVSVIRALAGPGGPAGREALVGLATDGGRSEDLRVDAIRAIGESDGADRVAALGKVLDTLGPGRATEGGEDTLHREAVRGLGMRQGDAAAAAVLAPFAKGQRAVDEDAWRQAVSAYARTAGPGGAEALLGVARDPAAPGQVRRAAWGGYLSVGGAEAAALLEETALRSPDAAERESAVIVLAAPRNEAGREALRRIVRDSTDEKTAALAKSLLW